MGTVSKPAREEPLEEIFLFRKKTEEKVERSFVLLEDEKKRIGWTNCTSVVWVHRGADKKAWTLKNIIIKE